MKITITFLGEDKSIPFDQKLKIIATIKRAAHNPVTYNDFEIIGLTGDDK